MRSRWLWLVARSRTLCLVQIGGLGNCRAGAAHLIYSLILCVLILGKRNCRIFRIGINNSFNPAILALCCPCRHRAFSLSIKIYQNSPYLSRQVLTLGSYPQILWITPVYKWIICGFLIYCLWIVVFINFLILNNFAKIAYLAN